MHVHMCTLAAKSFGFMNAPLCEELENLGFQRCSREAISTLLHRKWFPKKIASLLKLKNENYGKLEAFPCYPSNTWHCPEIILGSKGCLILVS